jgi:hypothetical protein
VQGLNAQVPKNRLSPTIKRGSYMSRVVEFSEAGGPEVLRFKNVDVPEAGPGQVRIRVKALHSNML